MARYVDFVDALRPPELRSVVVFGGPVADQQVSVGRNAQNQPEVLPSCENTAVTGLPGIRLRAFAAAINSPEDLSWSYSSPTT